MTTVALKLTAGTAVRPTAPVSRPFRLGWTLTQRLELAGVVGLLLSGGAYALSALLALAQ